MAILREGFRYTVRFVKQRQTKVGTVTDFQIGEKLGEEWLNFSCTMFDDLPINDGDKVKLKHIGSIEIKEGKLGKIFYDVVCDIEPLESDKPAHYEDTGTSDVPFDL